MKKEVIYALLQQNPVCFLATTQNDQPRVRGVLLYKADENGIILHVDTQKDVYKQIKENPKVEICFNDFQKGMQVRVTGELEIVEDDALKVEIISHPTRQFLRDWDEQGKFDNLKERLGVIRLKNAQATTWTMQSNFEPKDKIQL